LSLFPSFKSQDLGKITVVPFHSKYVPQGTVRSIKQTGLDEIEFKENSVEKSSERTV